MNIKQFLINLQEVEILDYVFTGGMLSLRVESFENSQRYDILIPTKIVEVNIEQASLGNAALTTCYFHIVDLATELEHKNNILVPAEDFGMFMTQKRKGLSLGYGLSVKKDYQLITLTGSCLLIALVCEDVDCINIKVDD